MGKMDSSVSSVVLLAPWITYSATMDEPAVCVLDYLHCRQIGGMVMPSVGLNISRRSFHMYLYCLNVYRSFFCYAYVG